MGIYEEIGVRPFINAGGRTYTRYGGSIMPDEVLAAMVETLRRDPGSFGLVSGVGMHMQKHTFGLWSTEPGAMLAAPRREEPEFPTTIVASPEGSATVATYSVLHGRDGEPTSALLVCDVPGGGRCYAKLDGGASSFAEIETHELIGRTVTLTPKDGVNLARIG